MCVRAARKGHGHREDMSAEAGVPKGQFPKGWFWQMFPCTELSSKQSFPAMLPWQKNPMIFDIPAPQKPERGHIRQNRPFTKPPLLVPLDRREETILTTPTPHICKKYTPKTCHTMGVRVAYKSLGFLQKIWHTDTKIWHTNPPPHFCHMNRFYWGWGSLEFVEQGGAARAAMLQPH